MSVCVSGEPVDSLETRLLLGILKQESDEGMFVLLGWPQAIESKFCESRDLVLLADEFLELFLAQSIHVFIEWKMAAE